MLTTIKMLQGNQKRLRSSKKKSTVSCNTPASIMKLVCHSDGSYLRKSKARSRAGDIFFLGDCADYETPNALICFLSVIIKTVVISAAATEYAAAFIVGQAAISIINTLVEDLDHELIFL